MTRFAVIAGFTMLFTTGPTAGAAHAASCAEVVGEAVAFLVEDSSKHRISVQMTGLTVTNRDMTKRIFGHGSFGESKSVTAEGDGLVMSIDVVFSDRKVGGHGFDPGKADRQILTFDASGGLTVRLASWNDAEFTMTDVACHGDGFVTGFMQGGRGRTLVSLSIHKHLRPALF